MSNRINYQIIMIVRDTFFILTKLVIFREAMFLAIIPQHQSNITII